MCIKKIKIKKKELGPCVLPDFLLWSFSMRSRLSSRSSTLLLIWVNSRLMVCSSSTFTAEKRSNSKNKSEECERFLKIHFLKLIEKNIPQLSDVLFVDILSKRIRTLQYFIQSQIPIFIVNFNENSDYCFGKDFRERN